MRYIFGIRKTAENRRVSDLLDLVNDFAVDPGETASVPAGWLEANKPEQLEHLKAMGFLRPDNHPMYVEYNGDAHEVHWLERLSEPPLPYCFKDEDSEFGGMHFLDDDELRGWRMQFGPLAELVRRSLSCRGQMREETPGFLWMAGTTTQQSREVWLCRSLSQHPELMEKIGRLPKSAILFQFGSVGATHSMEVALDIRLADVLAEDGEGHLALDAEAVGEMLAAKFAVRRGECGNTRPVFGAQNSYQFALQKWLWGWFDARLKAARVVEFNDGPDPDINERWVDFEILTQKQICDEIGIQPNVFTRAKEAWKEDVAGYGQFYLLITDEFVRRRPMKSKGTASADAARRLNDFYNLHREVITSARMHRPHTI